MQTITAAPPSGAYKILAGAGLLAQTGLLIERYAKTTKRLAVVSEPYIWSLYGSVLEGSLRARGHSITAIMVPRGEEAKSFAALEKLCSALLDTEITRSESILAFGGGAVTDLAGLAAALVRRGLGLINVPTTLLGQVDAAIGGKTAIDMPQGKNLVGAFHQPRLVIADSDLLASLPQRELRAGYAEIVKYALINDAGFFHWLNEHGADFLSGGGEARAQAIARSAAAKAAIISADERESGARALLNLGHSFGHALEAAAGGGLLHGEAVAAGIGLAARFSLQLGLLKQDDARAIAAHLRGAGLDLCPRLTINAAALADYMKQDKKNTGSALKLILLRGIGRAFIHEEKGLERIIPLLASALKLEKGA